MSAFTRVPDELILKIANNMNESAELCRLSLVCRTFQRGAQEALFHSIILPGDDGDLRASTPFIHLAQLIETLFHRPHLANIVKKLEIAVNSRRFLHAINCATTSSGLPCSCGRTSKIESILSILKQSGFSNDTWIERISAAYEPALIGLMLGLLPSLTTIRIRAPSGRYWVSEDFFGVSQPPIVHILGLKNVVNFESYRYVMWALELPALRYLEMPAPGSELLQLQILPSASLGSNITHFKVHFERNPEDSLEHALGTDQSDASIIKYMQTFTTQLKHLQHLHISFIAIRHWSLYQIYRLEASSYNNIIRYYCPENLRTLIVDFHDPTLKSWHQSIQAQPIQSLYNNSKLRRTVAPQDALFSVTSCDDIDLDRFFPPTIESIEVIDSTRALNKWARALLDNREQVPKLQRVVLWCDETKMTLVDDRRLHESRDVALASMSAIQALSYMSIGNHDHWRESYNIGNEVWDELRKEGIEVIEKTYEDRGKWGFQ